MFVVFGRASSAASDNADAVSDSRPAATLSVDANGSSSPSVLVPTPSVSTNAARGHQSAASPMPSATAKSTPKAVATVPANLAGKLKHLPSGTTQVVIVHAPNTTTTYAKLETFTKSGGVWKTQFASMTARVGRDGVGTKAQEGVPITPIGMFSFGDTMYGAKANPGVHFKWHHLVTDDWWAENSDLANYNTFVHGSDPGGPSEALWQTIPAYNYFAVITYNMPPNVSKPVPGAGSGIFLHVATSNPTAGCVSLQSSDLVKVLTWLDPAKHPRIVISTDSGLSQF